MKSLLEICCYSLESAFEASRHGAHRIELCDNYAEGGTTPSYGSIKEAVQQLSIPVNVMIRPRGGDFLYSVLEYKSMLEDIRQVKELGANGVVAGFLKEDGKIDLERTKEVLDLARPMEFTFHRAFDMCLDPLVAMEELIELGVDRVLTSGGRASVSEGLDMLSRLVVLANSRIIIMPGAGVNPDTLPNLVSQTRATEYHSSALNFVPSKMNYRNPHISMGGVEEVDEYRKPFVDGMKIHHMLDILREVY